METSIHSAPVTQELGERVDFFISERLRPSSKSTINTAVSKHWLPFVEAHGLPEFIPSGHYKRGSIMAAWVATMVSLGLVYSTISGYVWGVVDHHLTNHYASPVANVRDWAGAQVYGTVEPRLGVIAHRLETLVGVGAQTFVFSFEDSTSTGDAFIPWSTVGNFS
jgi:hypothetical protein